MKFPNFRISRRNNKEAVGNPVIQGVDSDDMVRSQVLPLIQAFLKLSLKFDGDLNPSAHCTTFHDDFCDMLPLTTFHNLRP